MKENFDKILAAVNSEEYESVRDLARGIELDFTTVYRHLNFMIEAGVLKRCLPFKSNKRKRSPALCSSNRPLSKH